MPQMYCSHVAYCTTLRCSNSHHQPSPQEILAVRGGAINLILDVLTFTTNRLPRDPSSQRWNYVGEKWPMNFAWNAPLPRSILGTDGFTSPPKEGVLRIFSPWKIRRLRPGLNPRTWVPKASTLPLDHRSRLHRRANWPWTKKFAIFRNVGNYSSNDKFYVREDAKIRHHNILTRTPGLGGMCRL